VYSYGVEQAQGERYNLIEAIMHQYGVDVQSAMDRAGELVIQRMHQYNIAKKNLPVWGNYMDAQIAKYCSVMEDWMVGNIHWSLESERYFGKDVAKVRDTLAVTVIRHAELTTKGQDVTHAFGLAETESRLVE
jgi:hypothetical protein